MKDTEFIELLNLYLDHELTPADCARLEAEVKTNPARRRVYQQYCRMQQGCRALAAETILAADFAAPARRRPVGLFAAGSLAAAAACVALLLIARAPQPADGTAAQAQAPVATAPAPAAVAVADSATRTGGIVQRAALAGDSIFLTRLAPGATGAAVLPQPAWIQDVQLAPMPQMVSAEQLRFDTQLKAHSVVSPNAKGQGSVIERSAFEFRP
jgi:hypothetical protein